MRTAIKETAVYNFNELSEEAKQIAKQWWLEHQEPTLFSNDCLQQIEFDYGITELKIEFSLSYSQGDGLCMHGNVSTYNDKFCNIITEGLTEQQKELFKEEIQSINFVKFNYHYSHSKTIHIELSYDSEESITDEVNTIMQIVFQNVCNWYFKKCKEFEIQGYAYFFEISDEDMNDCCEANDYEFTEEGKLYK